MDTKIIASKVTQSKSVGKVPFVQVVPCNCHQCRGNGWIYSEDAQNGTVA